MAACVRFGARDETWATRLLQEHAIEVFETRKLILDRVNGRLRGMDWDGEEQRADTGIDLIVKPFTAASLGRKVRAVVTVP